MDELTRDEFWLIEVYFAQHGFSAGHNISDVEFAMMQLECNNAEYLIQSLIKKKVLSLSPDGYKVKFTDYGFDLFNSMKRAQDDWEKQPIIRVTNLDHKQILIRAGEVFRADRFLREIFSVARKELCILDPFIGSRVFDLLEDSGLAAHIRIITSEKLSAATKSTYLAFHKQRPQTEMRTTVGDIHDRFIIWDGTQGFHLGHSIKDLGTKDTQLNLIAAPHQHLTLFEQRWKQAAEII
jgi:hypothetical protein